MPMHRRRLVTVMTQPTHYYVCISHTAVTKPLAEEEASSQYPEADSCARLMVGRKRLKILDFCFFAAGCSAM